MHVTSDIHVLFLQVTSDIHVLFLQVTSDIHVLFLRASHCGVFSLVLGVSLRVIMGPLSYWTVVLLVQVTV